MPLPRVRGPERLAPEWWRTHEIDPGTATRDYFAVEDTDGGRFWLFREGLYLAGIGLPCRCEIGDHRAPVFRHEHGTVAVVRRR